jgi:hypothetical protein
MDIPEYFESFLEEISLSCREKERISKAIKFLENFCSSDGPMDKSIIRLFTHGSFAHGTALSPIEDHKDYDVDVMMILNLKSLGIGSRDPSSVLKWLTVRLRSYYECFSYLENIPRIMQRQRCVRIEYAADFHIDVVPSYYEEEWFSPRIDKSFLRVPDRDSNWWIKSNPEGFTNWFSSIDAKHRGQLAKVVKMVKHWRDIKFDARHSPSSIILETLCGKCIPSTSDSDEELFIGTVENILSCLTKSFYSISVLNPSLLNENLGRNWECQDISLFESKLKSALKQAGEARDARRFSTKIKLWSKILGDDFPEYLG